MDDQQRPNGIPVTRFTLQSIYAQSDDEKLEFDYESGNMSILVCCPHCNIRWCDLTIVLFDLNINICWTHRLMTTHLSLRYLIRYLQLCLPSMDIAVALDRYLCWYIVQTILKQNSNNCSPKCFLAIIVPILKYKIMITIHKNISMLVRCHSFSNSFVFVANCLVVL